MNDTEAKQAADFRQQAALNSATPKPRAGEHTWHDDKMLILALRDEVDALTAHKRGLAQDIERVANSIDFVLGSMPAKMKPGLQAVADELRQAIAKHGR